MNKKILIAATLLSSMVLNAHALNLNEVPTHKLESCSLPTSLTSPSLLDAEVASEYLLNDKTNDKRRPCFSNNLRISDFAVKQEQIKPYKFMDDMTFAGVPLFVAGIIAKSEKASFRQDYNNQNARTRLITNFHNEIDNYTQYVPFALAAGLNFSGVKGRSDTWRFLASSAMSYALMAAIVNPIKYSAKEMRPDGSTRNSWPSGHTATAFASATILHKEYGLTRSPWYSVVGYGIATATGVMRVLNNRHWVSDVLSGAGIGIVSTELAYGLSDLIFKGKHLKRNDLATTANIIEHPSFFSISMGVGLGSRNLTFSGKELGLKDKESNQFSDVNLKFGTATIVGAEGAYFLNKYFGVGGRLRVKSSPIKGWSNVVNTVKESIERQFEALIGQQEFNYSEWAPTHDITIESDHITEFTGDLGAYFNIPLSHRLALGSKLLIGRSIIQDLDVNGHYAGKSLDLGTNGSFVYGNPYDVTWDYLTVSGNNTTKYGTGLSLTYAHKSNFSWKIFADYDFTRKHYTMEYSPTAFLEQAFPFLYAMMQAFGDGKSTYSSTIKKNMNSFVLGAAFTVSF